MTLVKTIFDSRQNINKHGTNAEKQRQMAEKQRQMAEKQRQMAEKQRQMAEKQRQMAERAVAENPIHSHPATRFLLKSPKKPHFFI